MFVEMTIRVAIIVVLSVLGALFRRIPLFQHTPGKFTKDDLPELQKQFAKWESFAILPLFGFGALFTWMAYGLFVRFADYYYSLGEQPIYQVTIPAVVWLIPSLFVGLVSCIPILDRLYHWLLKDRYADYMEYCDLRHGIHGWRALLLLCWGLLLAGALLIPQMLWAHASFYADEIRLQNFLAFSERTFDYNEVTSLAHIQQFQAPNGQWNLRPHHVLTMDDGTTWTTRSLSDPDPVADAELFAFLSKQTGLPVANRAR